MCCKRTFRNKLCRCNSSPGIFIVALVFIPIYFINELFAGAYWRCNNKYICNCILPMVSIKWFTTQCRLTKLFFSKWIIVLITRYSTKSPYLHFSSAPGFPLLTWWIIEVWWSLQKSVGVFRALNIK